MNADERYMKQALELAASASGLTFPNPLVGALVVSAGEVVGEGFHSAPGRDHAEVEAISKAGKKAYGATLYLNLEPCCHQGRTPPCTDSIIRAGISRVVFSIYDPDPRVRGKGARILRERGIEVEVGVLATEALELNLPFVHKNITGRSFVALKLALTWDGRMTCEGETWLSGEESRKQVHLIRAGMEAIAIGKGTLRIDDPMLDRCLYPLSLPPPVRMIFDSSLEFPVDHRWLAGGERVILYGTTSAGKEQRKKLEEAGAEVVILPASEEGNVDLAAWKTDISAKNFTSVLVEGGGRISTSLFRQGLMDRMILFSAPLVSGSEGVGWFQDGIKPDWFNRDEFVLNRVRTFGNDLMAVYDRSYLERYREMMTTEESDLFGFD
ncbi:MAG: bifunctional diaminohydroxyphosphoribosylaminopyrimidine deaminase/5-amino-6-(5-phosphoribosylamino)uracil reductase RibD [Candidatus Krumholzibacteriota bacterium]|nr:bifunctional diaminohydroxyphosphoribosylaminopyrimidine deaminase/5-amino-6-(5-phosphoribosylamino)uracil reductase RibD [Candidatus Krumholzibacteriota bacterium]